MAKKKEILLNNKSSFLLSIREGLGMAVACEISRNSPADIKEAMNGDPAFKADVDKAHRGTSVDLLKMVTHYNENNDYKSAAEARSRLAEVKPLVIWESVCTAAKCSPETIVEQFMLLRDGKEVAVACGLTYPEYIQMLTGNPAIISMIENLKNAG